MQKRLQPRILQKRINTIQGEALKGSCWLLCHLKSGTEQDAVKDAFRGYGHRWKIEEVHRQIKMDYDLEMICLQRYEASRDYSET